MVREQTDGFDFSFADMKKAVAVDLPFTGAEIKMALEAFDPKIAPGIDGFTVDICYAAVGLNLVLFLAIANKCLDLKHLPKALEGSCHKGNSEAQKGQLLP
ncbi:hypothetical protein EVAR_92453_1 [Eumeta japonica]|uniref:Uncharacterized protein n=1 Tax=Eumeta variegata TaxID=151549 RepID=A0A4C1T8N5_EUMVA|nr:hypothetical protein EVAR_92453_1 [Eumeta japonica]